MQTYKNKLTEHRRIRKMFKVFNYKDLIIKKGKIGGGEESPLWYNRPCPSPHVFNKETGHWQLELDSAVYLLV